MRLRVGKWGSCLAVRIPKVLARQAEIERGTVVDISVRNDRIFIRKVVAEPTLEELLSKITKDNIHREIR